MNEKLRSILSLSLLLGSKSKLTPETTPVGGTSKVESSSLVNSDFTCFKPGCSKHRKGNNLYCSVECCKKDRERVKQRLTRK